ncbi:target of Nesh-SH3 isoform X4 [Varanus komodoensis]|uniref:target of Nesh-SH3 isoform X4 n=1 Tax=Varanus komodoensis TaxID=61221 RepID=UPI001CF7C5F6|nr:target of Nesh-SH3 isoform X4 [Varanus komodoensis]
MISRLVFLLFCGNIALNLGNVQKLPRVKRQSLRVQINVTDDTVCMRYIRPSLSTKLEGFILGYGSSFFSNQYISLPSDGKSYITEVDAEPRYLIAVRPAPVPNYKKPCSGKMNKLKPLQLVIGTLTPTSAFLSWGVLVNPKHDWTTMNNCANGRFYTVRYREKDKNKKWVLQLCPTTETVVDNLKPNTVYEFGVKDNTDNGIWSKSFSHKMAVPGKSKENGQLQNNIKLSKIPTFIPVDSKARIPITIIKQVLQNITHRAQSKSPEKFPVSGPIQVHIIIPDLSGTQQKLPSPVRLDISETPKKTLAQNESQEWPSESKTAEVQEISPQSYPAMTVLDWERSQPTAPSVSEESESSPVHTESDLESSKPSITPMVELPLSTLAPRHFPEFPKTKTTPPLQIPTEILASSEMQPVPSVPQTPAPKTTQTKPVYSKPQPAFSRATASDEIDLSDSKPVTNEPLEALTPKTSKALDQPRATLAPSETPFIPFKWEPSATPEGRHLKPVPSLPPLKQDTPKISRITEQLKSTPAPLETKFVPSTPKPFARPETPELKYEKEPQWESTTTSIYKTPELPRTTLAPSKTKIPVSKPQILPHLEEPKTVPAVTSKLIPVPTTTKVSHTVGHPVTTMASYEPSSVRSKSKESKHGMPEVPDSKPVLEPFTFSNELPTVAPKAKHHVPSHKTTISPHVLHPKPEKKDPEPFRHETQLSPDEPQTKPDIEAVTIGKEKSKTTIAPKVSHQIPARTKTSPSPGIISTKPSTKSGRRVSSKPSPKVPQTKPAEIIQFSQDPISTMIPQATETAKPTLASAVEQFIPNKSKPSTRPRMLETKPAAVLQTTSQPFILKPTMSSETPKLTMASKGTQLKPKTPGKSDVSQTKAVSSKPHSSATTESPRLKTVPHKIYLTTAKPKTSEKPHGRLVINKTTPAPGRTKTPGGFTWGKVSRGDKLTDRDATRVLSTSSSISYNTPVDSAVARKKPEPVATPPDSPRPPLAPAKPTPMKRKPLPPNTVTGKPGRSGNILMPQASSFSTASSTAKPTGPASLTKTGSPKKLPTAASSPDYSNPMFSSLPTTETDIAGTPRYRGDHVKYIKKEESVPCSITDTLQHFPTEEGDSTERATAPPQKPPTNLTVVTVEGCPSFVILDWEKPQNETVTEYKVVSTENGGPVGKDKSIITTNQTHSTVENLKPNTSYEFVVIPSNPLGEGPSSESKPFKTESADPRVTEPIPMGKDAIWTEIKFNSDTYSECKGKQYVKRTWYKKFVGVQVCNSLRYKIYLSDSLTGTFYNIGDQRGHGEDHCQFVDSYLDGRTGQQLPSDQLPTIDGYYRAVRQEPVHFGKIGAETHTNYVQWYECGTTIPGKW